MATPHCNESESSFYNVSYFHVLPNELALHILGFLTKAKDITNIKLTCKHLHHLAKDDSLWKRFCQVEYGISTVDGWGNDSTTFYDLYTKVLFPFGSSVGYWINSQTPYGICVHVKLEKGRIVARCLKYPIVDNISVKMEWTQPTFTITWKEGKGHATCCQGCQTNSVSVKVTGDTLAFSCKHCYGKQHLNPPEDFASWWTEDGEPILPLLYQRVKEIGITKVTSSWTAYELQRLPPVIQSPLSPVQLGYYKGTYGSHGIEVIKLQMAEDGVHIHGLKILGDLNVPSGVISLYIDLRRPMTLTLEQQQSLGMLKDLNVGTQDSPYKFPSESIQPFTLPLDIFNRNDEELHTQCKARYAGLGQIAGYGFQDPDLAQGHFVVFSEDHFGFLWIDLSSFSAFERLGDDLS